MGCIIEVGKPTVRINFTENKYTQKLWVEALLHCTKVNISELAIIIAPC